MSFHGFDIGACNSLHFQVHRDGREAPYPEVSGRAMPYIPTAVAAPQQEKADLVNSHFGTAALDMVNTDDYRVFRHFKPWLAEGDPGERVAAGYMGENQPEWLMELYLSHMVQAYTEPNRHDPIEKAVVTVPAAWSESGISLGRDRMFRICQGVFGDTPFAIVSEPVAAAAFFCRHYLTDTRNNPSRTPFEGFLAVIDFGGGTLDISICWIDSLGRITVVNNFGISDATVISCANGQPLTLPGRAGIAHDRAAIQYAFEDAFPELFLDQLSGEYTWMARDFESRKISFQTQQKLELYLKDKKTLPPGEEPVMNDTLFKIKYEGYVAEVRPSHLEKAFEEVIRPGLENAIDRLQADLDKLGINYGPGARRFKALLVGGFSNYTMVRELVYKKFGCARVEDDWRFQDYLQVDDRSYAVARGASLLAAGLVNFSATVPFTVGVEGVDCIGGIECQGRFSLIPLLDRGSEIPEEMPLRSKHPVCVLVHRGVLVFYLDYGNGTPVRRIQLDPEANTAVLDMIQPGLTYSLSFEVDYNLNYWIVFAAPEGLEAGNEIRYPMGQLFNELNAIVIHK